MAIGKGISPMLRRFRGTSYGAYTTAWYTQVLANGGTATSTELAALTVFENSVGATDMAEFDRLGIMGLQNQVAARVSFVNPTSTLLTLVNSPTFTAGQGFTGNASTMYINTNYNTSTGTKYTRNSACYGVLVRTTNTGAFVDIGNSGANLNNITARFSTSTYFAINCGASNTASTNADSKGIYSVVRDGASSYKCIKNGVQLATTGSHASVTPNNANFFLLANNSGAGANSYSPNQLAAWWAGSGVINQATFHTALQTLATTLGFNV